MAENNPKQPKPDIGKFSSETLTLETMKEDYDSEWWKATDVDEYGIDQPQFTLSHRFSGENAQSGVKTS